MKSIKRQANLLAKSLGPKARGLHDLEHRLAALGGLGGLHRAGADGLSLSPALTRQLAAMLQLFELWRAPPPLTVCEGPEDIVRCLGPWLEPLEVETVWVVLLDARARPFAHREVARGTLNACAIHPREVLKLAVRAAAASFVLVHNHPSGDPEPSPEDHQLTDQMGAAGLILGIPLIDHIVVGTEGYRSLGPGRFAVDKEPGWAAVEAAGLCPS